MKLYKTPAYICMSKHPSHFEFLSPQGRCGRGGNEGGRKSLNRTQIWYMGAGTQVRSFRMDFWMLSDGLAHESPLLVLAKNKICITTGTSCNRSQKLPAYEAMKINRHNLRQIKILESSSKSIARCHYCAYSHDRSLPFHNKTYIKVMHM